MSAIDRPVGPSNGIPTVFAVTTGSVHVDLTATASGTAVLLKAIRESRILTIKSEGDVWYRWSPNTTGDTVDETMVASGGTPANQAAVIFTGERVDESPPTTTQGLVIKASGSACKLRIWAS